MGIKHTRSRRFTASTTKPLMLSAHGRLRRLARLSGMGFSIVAISLSPHVVRADGPAFGTPGWAAARGAAGGSSGAPPVSGVIGANAGLAGIITPDQATARASRSMGDLAAAARILAAANAAQRAAAVSASSAISVPNGLVEGGLVPDSGLAAPGTASPVPNWVHLDAPVQTQAGAATQVTIEQTAPKAIANWRSFNVGARTTVHFDQTAGTQTDGSNNWIVFNRITDPSATPSLILGSIHAEGSVYLINNSGIVFGAGSQVDTHALLASTLNLYSNDSGIANGIFLNANQGIASFTAPPLPGNTSGLSPVLVDPGNAGNISVEAGATIRTGTLGYSLLAAPTVSNAGTIIADDGQAILIGSRSLALEATAVNATVGAAQLRPYNFVPTGSVPVTQVINNGVIQAARGNVSLIALDVEQNGVVAISTGIVNPGSITLTDGASGIGGQGPTGGRVAFGRDSLTAILPDSNGQTTPTSSAGSFVPGSLTVAAASASFEQGALVEAPGANLRIAVTQGATGANVYGVNGRIFIDQGAVIDVSGLDDVQLPFSSTLVSIPRIGQNELADSPVQRSGFLFRQINVVVDSALTGTRADGTPWIGSPILNASGYVNQIPLSIQRLLTNAGSISVTGTEFISQTGSLINLDGGYQHFLAGQDGGTTRLQTADGHLYAIGNADPMFSYNGFAGSYSINHARAGIVSRYVDPILGGLLAPKDSGYIAGGNAGALLLGVAATGNTPAQSFNTVLLAGDLSAQVYTGRKQIETGVLPTGGALRLVTANALVVRDSVPALDSIAPEFGELTPVTVAGKTAQDPTNLAFWNPIDGTALSAAGFASVTLNAAQIRVASGGLSVQQGGHIDLSAGRVSVDADLTATSGSIAITSGTQSTTGITFIDPASTAAPATADIVIASGVTVSTRGRFVNDYGVDVDAQAGPAAINGGSISLTARGSSAQQLVSGSRVALQDNTNQPVYSDPLDTTGAIVLSAGSTLDVSGGGYVRPDGTVVSQNGLPSGSGGNVSLISYPILSSEQRLVGRGYAPAQPQAGSIQLGGRILADGLSGGGTFSLRALNLEIGEDTATTTADPTMLRLASSFFSGQGFASYQLSTPWDATIADGTTIRLTHDNFISDATRLRLAPTGADLYASDAAHPTGTYASLGSLDDYRRAPTNLSIAAGDYLFNLGPGFISPTDPGVSGSLLLGQQASILADAGASVRLSAFNQLTVLGSIVSHGGSITLSGDTSQNVDSTHGGYAPPSVPAGNSPYSSLSKSIWLGADSRLDVSGVALLDPLAASPPRDGQLAAQPRSGRVLDGGSITLSNDSGYIVALAGAQLEASGTQASLDLLSATGSPLPGRAYTDVSTDVWSDGGTITLGAAGGLLFDGSLHAAGGNAQARGGTLRITGENSSADTQAGAIILRQSGDFVPEGLAPGDEIDSGRETASGRVPSGFLYFAADRITQTIDPVSGAAIASGIDNLILGQDPSASLIRSQSGSTPLTIDFSGSVSLALPGSISITATQLRARQAGDLVYTDTDPASVGATAVSINAGYVALAGYTYGGRTSDDLGSHVNDATLSVTARDGLDISGTLALQNFASSQFTTNGDLRLYTASALGLTRNRDAVVPGLLFSSGDLGFTAARLYPASSNRFLIVAADPGHATTVRFASALGSTNAALPLSAGGELLVDATQIEQGGALFAPYGSIQLGVSDPAHAAADYASLPFAGASLPLVATDTLTLAAGSLTSVGGAGLVVPYGATIDGQNLQYDAIHNPQVPASATVLGAPPAKQLVLGAAAVSLADGATVDLRGGGDLQAQEFIPGTGGTRDLLATTSNTRSALFQDGRGVYAIVPGYSTPLGAYDPAFDTAGSGALVGQSVHLSGIGGLAEGDYVLLPARYASLPGAYRVVQNTAASDSLASRNIVLPDGSYLSAGYFVDGLARSDGSAGRDARSTSFTVQSNTVWQQYSQYTLTTENNYFASIAAKSGTATPPLPADAGQLVLAASRALSFGADFLTAGATAGSVQGAAAQVDITARDLQVLGAGSTALDGYVQLTASDLNRIGAGSLLLGGVRTATTAGTTITAAANSIVIGDARTDGTPGGAILSGPELILATRTDAAAGTATADPVAVSSGVLIGRDSVVSATGSFPAARDTAVAVTGDGTLLRVSNGAAVSVIRSGTSADGGTAALSLLAGARINGGQALSLDSSHDINVDPAALFSAHAIDIGAAGLRFIGDDAATGAAASGSGLALGTALIDQLGAADQLSLRARDGIAFVGDVTLVLHGAVSLTAPVLSSDGGMATISVTAAAAGTAGKGVLTLSGGSAATAAAEGSGSLAIDADKLVFGPGSTTLSGFKTVAGTTTDRVLGNGVAKVDFGAADVALNAPLLTVNTGSLLNLTTTGTLELTTAATNAAATTTSAGIGGVIMLDAASLSVDSSLVAHAGNIVLTTHTGDLTLGSHAIVDASGLARTFFDTTQFAPGGNITLSSAAGLAIDGASHFEFGGAATGGDAGSLNLQALNQTSLLGTIGLLHGAAKSGYLGGSLALDTGGAVDLDTLADTLSGSGVTQSVSVHSRIGNLLLDTGHTIIASTIALTADGDGLDASGKPAISVDDGNVSIAGVLDASGSSGGAISLNGFSGISLSGSLIATGSSASERGGTVTLATSSAADPATVDARYGFEQLTAAQGGSITLAPGAHINVSGGSAGGLSGGTVALRAPLLAEGALNLTIDPTTTITGAREIGIEAYAVWDTRDASSGSTHFDGVIDAASNPGFYRTTLANFVSQAPFAFESQLGGIPHLAVRPGIELRNSDLSLNGGDITVASNWNLGAVTLDSNGQIASHLYRHGDLAPVVTLRAAHDVAVNASLTDGFVQLSNPLGLQAAGPSTLADASALYAVLVTAYPELAAQIATPATFVSDGTPQQSAEIAQYYGLYQQYLNYLLYAKLPVGSLSAKPVTALAPASRIETQGIATLSIGAPVAPQNPQGYANYLVQYEAYLAKREGGVLLGKVVLPAPPPTRLVPAFTSAAIGGPVDNSASPVATASNPLPIASATIAGGDSSSFRLIAGADAASADVLATSLSSGGGDVRLDGHVSYTDSATGNAILSPTVIRTGNGAIAVAAAQDIALLDPNAPGTIYTAGIPVAGRSANSNSSLLQTALYIGGTADAIVPAPNGEYLVTGAVQPEGGGDLSLAAGRDIKGVEAAFSNTGNGGQFWWEWLQTGHETAYSLDGSHNGNSGLVAGGIDHVTATSINFGAFDQGLLSAGGNVRVRAGGSISDLSVSLPTTWYFGADAAGTPGPILVGGGNLSVTAGGNILSGSYFVAKGAGLIRAGGDIGSDLQFGSSDVGTILAVQDASLDVQARGNVALSGVYNPSYLPAGLPGPLFSADSQAYSADSRVSVTTTAGDLRFGTLSLSNGLGSGNEPLFFGTGSALGDASTLNYSADILPATLSLAALGGGLSIEKSGELYPSAIGNLSLIANDSITLANNTPLINISEAIGSSQDRYFGLIDADPHTLPSPFNQPNAVTPVNLPLSLQRQYRYISSLPSTLLHSPTALHGADYAPVRVYSLNGDIVDGTVGSDGVLRNAFVLAPDKLAQIRAGRDIVNLSFLGQHVHDSDLSLISAGRDFYDTAGGSDESRSTLYGSEPSISIGGPGSLTVQAGRDIGPLTNQNGVVLSRIAALQAQSVPITGVNLGTAPTTGFVAIGNNGNPYLPHRSADISLLFGVAPGVAQDAFIANYIDPAQASTSGLPSFSGALIDFVRHYQAGLGVDTGYVRDQPALPPVLDASTAFALFRSLSAELQQRLVAQVFFDILRITGTDAANPSSTFSNQYARAYRAIETLFPSARGYTLNNLQGGTNGATSTVNTGDLDLRGTTVQTQQGGTISLLGPGGEALIGSTAAPAVVRDTNGNVFAGAGTQGVLALQQGDVRIFTDRSLLLAQSRVFTEGGGNIVIFSSNGDVNAGRGARTTADTPAPAYLCNPDYYCAVDARGQVTGAGIATLQITAGAQPGDLFLIAPRGTVDAGDAGIRVSGNLIVAAQTVANADNIQVQGSAIGIRATAVDSGTLSAGSNAAVAAQQQATALASRPVDRAANVITVEVFGFGTPDEEQKKKLQH